VFLIHQRLTSPSQGEAVKSMGNFEAQTPLLTNTQKNISISKKKSTGQIIIPYGIYT
jgi:hypothetical protein